MVEEFRFGYLFNFDIFGIGYVYWIKNICRLGYIYIYELVSEFDVYVGN